jgi:hypothetical protein
MLAVGYPLPSLANTPTNTRIRTDIYCTLVHMKCGEIYPPKGVYSGARLSRATSIPPSYLLDTPEYELHSSKIVPLIRRVKPKDSELYQEYTLSYTDLNESTLYLYTDLDRIELVSFSPSASTRRPTTKQQWRTQR